VAPARAIAEDRGLAAVRELWQMALDPLVAPAVPPLPDGVVVRPFVPGRDEEAWVG
jgi:hypothetical protein